MGKPEVRQFIADHVEDVLSVNPELDRIHLDIIRFRYWKSILSMDIRDAADFGRLMNEGDIFYLIKEAPGPAGHAVIKLAYLKTIDRTRYSPYDGTRAILEKEYMYYFCDDCLRRFQGEKGVEIPRQSRRTREKADRILWNQASNWCA